MTMEQPSFIHITRVDTTFRFRLESPDTPTQNAIEATTELSPEQQERLRRVLQNASQQMQNAKNQGRRAANSDSLVSLGRFLFDTLLPSPIQDGLRQLDSPLLLDTNTPDIPWELLYDGKPGPGHFLCQHLSMARQANAGHGGNTAGTRSSISERLSVETSLMKSRGLKQHGSGEPCHRS